MRLDNADWPIFGWVTDIRPALFDASAAMQKVVLATLIRVDGPSPRPVGSQMLLKAADAIGYFSGGCLEADVANHAQAVYVSGDPRRLVYGHGSPWIDIRLLCGGTLEILLELVHPDDGAVDALDKLSKARRPAWWVSDGRSRRVMMETQTAAGEQYVVRYDPNWRLAIVGGDPIALAIAGLAVSAGFETIMIRQDGPETAPPLAGVNYVRGSARTAIEQLAPDRWTAVVTATHDDAIDDEAIFSALSAEAAYVGVLGSAKRIVLRRDRLSAAGLTAPKIAALHAPIGVARCGKAPWEVAVSVIAEIMQTRTDQSTVAMDDVGRGLMHKVGISATH